MLVREKPGGQGGKVMECQGVRVGEGRVVVEREKEKLDGEGRRVERVRWLLLGEGVGVREGNVNVIDEGRTGTVLDG